MAEGSHRGPFLWLLRNGECRIWKGVRLQGYSISKDKLPAPLCALIGRQTWPYPPFATRG